MNDFPSDLASLLGRCQTSITALLRQTSTPSERAARLAELLLELSPRASLTACLLRGDEPSCLAIRPKEISLDTEQENAFTSQLSSLPSLRPGVQTLPAAPLPGSRLLAAAMGEPDCPRGFLAIGLPTGAATKEVTRAEALLAVAAPTAALRWALEAVRAEQAELARFALVGQAFIGLAHDLNNALNSMMLQTSVVQLRVDEAMRHELAIIRQQGAQAASLVRTLQLVVQERREQSYAVDLGGILAALLEENAELRRRVMVQPPGQAPSIQCTRSAVKQLVRLLLEGVLAGTKSAVQARAEDHAGQAALRVELAEAAEEGDLPSADALLWQNLDEVSRQAGQALLRQLGGMLEVEPRREKGLILRVVWTAAS